MREPKPVVKPSKIEHVKDGEPYRYPLNKAGKAVEMSICCDCSLVHLMEFKPGKRSIRVRVWREDGLTDQLRKNPKKKVV